MSSPVSVSILGKEYQIACPEEEKPALISSAQLLHSNMEQIQSSGKIIGLDRIAVMAALNLAHELINLRDHEGNGLDDVNKSILLMKEKVSAFLEEERQLEL
ncbi:MAG: cell division protein ZapA [Gammaproteobacteria bacterium]|nr:MAG: cell division protein ZapA [Gammaproteobacteria bacterium]RKZ95096.1 MAG: cell division protein ZapA [Gammaproteobacteria bacterium]RLA01537.1 MAG: cell division protein ZapA [Gammaproteobacteria bacterium]